MSKEYEAYSLLGGEDDNPQDTSARKFGTIRTKSPYVNLCLAFLLCISLLSNLLQGLTHFAHSARPSSSRSNYAGLEDSEIRVQWPQTSAYTDSNTTIADAAWDSINHDSGIVAVSKDWAASKDLPLGSTFPWDSEKTLYFVNAYHGLHCLKNIYRAFTQYRDDVPQSLSYHHITHCLDQLRADVICHADDTPRVTTSDMRPVTGEGQWRTCRNWSKLEGWTMENPGCFRYGDPTIEDEKQSQIARMRFCPDNSKLLGRVRDYYGKGSDWFPARDKVYSWFGQQKE